MKTQSRFIKSVLETARNDETVMPWSRGARRAEMIARRKSAAEQKECLRSA